MRKFSKHIIEETKSVWKHDFQRQITEEEAEDIISNTIALFELIFELETKYNEKENEI